MKKCTNYILIIGSILLFSRCDKKKILSSYQDGSIKLECEMSGGLKNGLCIQYYANGEKHYESNYENDTLNGKSIFYHLNGKVNWEVDYVNGIKEGEIFYYDSLGNKFQKTTFKQSVAHGESIAFNISGDIVSKMNYSNGELDGVYESYYDGGQLKTKATYSNGTRLDFTTLDSLGNEIAKMIKYEITHRIENDNIHLTVNMLNQMYDIMGVRIMDFSYPESSAKTLEEEFSEDSFVIVKLSIPEGDSTFTVRGFITDIQDLEGGSGVVKRSIDFEYLINENNNDPASPSI
jgi:antitoxin component YwqK of YwqJK toxin-antitoxin module